MTKPTHDTDWRLALVRFDEEGTLVLNLGECPERIKVAIGTDPHRTENKCLIVVDPNPPPPPLVKKCHHVLSSANRLFGGRLGPSPGTGLVPDDVSGIKPGLDPKKRK